MGLLVGLLICGREKLQLQQPAPATAQPGSLLKASSSFQITRLCACSSHGTASTFTTFGAFGRSPISFFSFSLALATAVKPHVFSVAAPAIFAKNATDFSFPSSLALTSRRSNLRPTIFFL